MGSRNQDEDEDEGEIENNCEGNLSSPTWLAQFTKVDEGIQCDMCWYEAQVEKSPPENALQRWMDLTRLQNQGVMEKASHI